MPWAATSSKLPKSTALCESCPLDDAEREGGVICVSVVISN